MAQSGYTPIVLYNSVTPGATPAAGDLVDGELALNVSDGYLFYKRSGVVENLAGLSGFSGISGFSGTSGFSGFSGFSGVQGPTVYPGAGIANSTGSAWGTSYTTTGSGTVVSLQTTPVFIASRITVSALGTLTTGTTTIDLATAQVYTATITASNTITIAFSNAPSSGQSQIVLLRLTNAGGGTIVWPANTKFSAGTAPTLTTSGVDVLGVYYDVTTTTYMVFVIGLDVKVP